MTKTRVIILYVLGAAACLCLGVVIGYFSHRKRQEGEGERNRNASALLAKLTRDADPFISKKIIQAFRRDNIEKNLRYLTEMPHIAGSERDRELAYHIRDIWKEQLDSSQLYSYDVLLSYPNTTNHNKVQIIAANGSVIFENEPEEEILTPDMNHTDIIPPFNAYSPAGEALGDLIYVNYGRAEDFEKLEELGINVSRHIVIARYGKIFRGNKLAEAEKHGALGLILYSDPADYIAEGATSVYPDSLWLPGTGVQRGNVVLIKGDQLTQGYPSTVDAYRLNNEALEEILPKIPCLPIGYNDAEQLLKRMSGDEVPADWKGRLNLTYRLGPGFVGADQTNKVRLESHNYNEIATIDNVIGWIDGEIEPDRYVLVGGHRDAWVFGSVDPSSSTAVIMEMARVFSEVMKEGWRPRRSLVFCNWGGEEYGLIGSTEWVEEFSKVLGNNAVAYLNLDSAVKGNFTLDGRATPSLKNALKRAAQEVPDPVNPSVTLYDTWKERHPSNHEDGPNVGIPGSGSDFAPFIQALGVPVTYHQYFYDRSMNIASNPTYHSAYETFHLFQHFLDPDFHFSVAMGQITAELMRHLADSYILPLSANEYAKSLKYYGDILKEKYEQQLAAQGISLDGFVSAIKNFTQSAERFHEKLNIINKNNPIEVRQMNDQLLHLERAFIDPAGLPNRPLYKHIIFSPSYKDHYSGAAFCGLADLLYDIEEAPDQLSSWEAVKHHLGVIIYVIQSASHVLSTHGI